MAQDDEIIQKAKEKKRKESELWAAVTKDIIPLSPKVGINIQKNVPSPKKTPPAEPVTPPPTKPLARKPAPDLDHRTAERLRKGQMPIEARLDLHGLSRQAAYDALLAFIPRCYARGLRCVLVITGKGALKPLDPESGVLKQHTPQWLSAPPLDRMVLKYVAAKPKDGGSGALYVLLRRNRDFSE